MMRLPIHKSIKCMSLMLVILLVVISGSTNAVSVASAQSPFGNPTPYPNPEARRRAADEYWAKRHPVSPAMLRAARDAAARLPQANSLPLMNNEYTIPGQNSISSLLPSNAWRQIGPAPVDSSPLTGFSLPKGAYTGRINAIAVDTNTSGSSTVAYIGAANGGVWKTINNGTTWTPLTDTQNILSIGALAIDPNNHQVIYAGTGDPRSPTRLGEGILKSINGGATWALLGTSTFAGTTVPGATPYPYTTYITKIIVNPRNSHQIFVGTSIGLFVSTNDGSNWAQLTSGLPTGSVVVDDLDIDRNANPIRLYAAIRAYGLYRSVDGGTTWSRLTSGLPSSSAWAFRSALAVAPSNPSIIYVVLVNAQGNVLAPTIAPNTPAPVPYNGMYVTTNGGDNWFQVSGLSINFTGLPNSNVGQGVYDLYLAVDPLNYYTVYGGGIDIAVTAHSFKGIFPGDCGDDKWTNLTDVYNVIGGINSGVHTDQHSIAFGACTNSTTACSFYAGNDGGIYSAQVRTYPIPSLTPTVTNPPPTSTGAPTFQPSCLPGTPTPTTAPSPVATFTSLNASGLAISQFVGGDSGSNFASTPLAIGGMQDNGVALYKSTLAWSGTRGGDGGFSAIDWSSPNVMYTTNGGVSINNAFLKNTNSGAATNWATATNGLSGLSLFYAPFQLDRANHTHLIYGTQDVYETTNAANSWYKSNSNSITSQGTNGEYISALAIAPSNSAIIYAGSEFGPIWKTTSGNSGSSSTYTEVGVSHGFPSSYITQITVDPLNTAGNPDTTGSTVYVSFSGFTRNGSPLLRTGGIYKTADGGASWADITGNLPNIPVQSVIVYRSSGTRVLVAGTDIGVFYSVNEGTSWTYLNGAIPNAPVDQLVLDSVQSSIVAYTYGRSAWVEDIAHTATPTPSNTPTPTYTPTITPTRTPTPTVTPIPRRPDTIGLYLNGTFYLRNSNTTGYADITVPFGSTGNLPVTGDWNGDGVDTIGIYDTGLGSFFLRDSNTPGYSNYGFVMGNPGDTPLAGKWDSSMIGDGVGVFRPSNGLIYLKKTLASGFADYTMVLGNPGDHGIAGDWDGNGYDSIGVYRPSNGYFYLSNTVGGTTNNPLIVFSDYSFFVTGAGATGAKQFAGDWNATGSSKVGYYGANNLNLVDLRNTLTGGFPDTEFTYGTAGSLPVAGKWTAGSQPPRGVIVIPNKTPLPTPDGGLD